MLDLGLVSAAADVAAALSREQEHAHAGAGREEHGYDGEHAEARGQRCKETTAKRCDTAAPGAQHMTFRKTPRSAAQRCKTECISAGLGRRCQP